MSKEHTFQQPLETSKYVFPIFEVETSKQCCCRLNLLILGLLHTFKDQFREMQKNRAHLFSTSFSNLLLYIKTDLLVNTVVY